MALLKRKKTGLGDPMSVVTRFVNAANQHDADGVAGCLHPDFDSIQPIYPSRNFRGADQVRRNWQAIFDAEPGFRLTVLRSVSAENTVWLELHGAGREAEVAGVFVMGVQGDRIRWARIYSALVEAVPEGEGQADVVETSDRTRAPLHEVRHDQEPGADPGGETGDGGDAVVAEPPMAPVLNMEDGPKTHRRRSARRRAILEQAAAAAPDDADAADDADASTADAAVTADADDASTADAAVTADAAEAEAADPPAAEITLPAETELPASTAAPEETQARAEEVAVETEAPARAAVAAEGEGAAVVEMPVEPAPVDTIEPVPATAEPIPTVDEPAPARPRKRRARK